MDATPLPLLVKNKLREGMTRLQHTLKEHAIPGRHLAVEEHPEALLELNAAR